MTDQQIVQKTADFIKEKFSNEGSGHDWWHMYRVWQLAKHIAQQEGKVNMLIVELAALLHDIADWKFHDDPAAGSEETRDWLGKLKVDISVIDEVAFIVEHISYKGGFNKYQMRTVEGKIVQDADRLDALGAIGVARTFAFGGSSGRAMYNPNIKPIEYTSLQQFKEKIPHNHTINHFYEKLLLLKDKMNTKTGKQIALARHEYMEKFLQEFYDEWDGKK